jgi:Lactate racemase N-terminal domain
VPGLSIGRLDWFELYRAAPPETLDLAPLGAELASAISGRVPKGARVGVAVGSRGIARLPEVVATVVSALRTAGLEPVLIPAMGSHGGATSDGQVMVLRNMGVDAEALGVPVDASMEVEQVGALANGRPVYLSRAAMQCDAIVPVNRVKPHSDFRAPVESGLTKMLTIGLGKEVGASSLHSEGFNSFVDVLPEAAQIVSKVLRAPLGVALVEDEWHRLLLAEVVLGEEILERDEALLKEAWAHFARLPFGHVDILLMKEMGKTISGAGMDPNVTGRFGDKAVPGATVVQRVVVLDLRDDSGGNAIGVGYADVVTERLRAKIDWGATYANARASKSLSGAKLPIVVESDADAFALASESLIGRDPGGPRIVAMASTLSVTHIAVSEPLVAEAEAAGYASAGGPQRAKLTGTGRLVSIGGLEFFT